MHRAHGMELVHMKPNEVRILNKFIGGGRKAHDGAWDMSGIEHVFNHPHVKEMMEDDSYEHELKHFAHGGSVGSVEDMKDHGRHGDTEMAYIPHHVAHLFDHVNGHSRNPHTGHREYFLPALAMGLARLAPMAMSFLPSLGNMFGTAARAAAPLASTAMRAAAPIARAATAGAGALGRGAATLGRGAMQAGRAVASSPLGRGAAMAGRGAMGAARMGMRGLETAGNIANAALPISMMYDRFAPQQQQQQQAPQYDPNETMMDLGNPGGAPSGHFARGAGSRGGMEGMQQAPSYGRSGYSAPMRGQGGGGYGSESYGDYSGYSGGSSYPYSSGGGYSQPSSYGEGAYNPGSRGMGGRGGYGGSGVAPQYAGGYAEALNRYGPEAYAPRGQSSMGRGMSEGDDYNPYGGGGRRMPQRSMYQPQQYNPYM